MTAPNTQGSTVIHPASFCEKPSPSMMKDVNQVRPERQRPIGAEGRRTAADEGARGQQLEIGHAGIGRRHRDGLHQRAFPAHHQPRRHPHQADHAERAEGIVPAVIDDDPVQRRHREDHAERRALRQDRGGQRALLVGKPFVERMRRHRECRSLAGAEDDAADHQRGETDGADHRELGQRPDHRHRQQHPAGIDAVDDEADRRGPRSRTGRRTKIPEIRIAPDRACNSALIGTPARLTTILSAKLTSMNRNRRNVIFQAPLGVGCVVMGSPRF